MFYVIERSYIGFDHDANIDASRIEITTEAEESAIFNDWRTTNHGSFASVESAREFIVDRFGVTRTVDPFGWDLVDTELFTSQDVVEIHKIGKYEPMSTYHSREWAWAGFELDIGADTTDSEIDALIEECAAEARNQGYELDAAAAKSAAIEYRDELRDEELTH